MIDLIAFIVFLLTVYRITRLIIEDEIFDTPRNWLYSKVPYDGKLYYLLGCPWCMSFWVAIPFTVLYVLSPTGMIVLGLPFAASAVTGLINQKVD